LSQLALELGWVVAARSFSFTVASKCSGGTGLLSNVKRRAADPAAASKSTVDAWPEKSTI
jgi:hypothetical protein